MAVKRPKTIWWHQYKDRPDLLWESFKKLGSLQDKYCEARDSQQLNLIQKHGHGHIGGLSKQWRNKFWELDNACNHWVHPLVLQQIDILDYLTSVNYKPNVQTETI